MSALPSQLTVSGEVADVVIFPAPKFHYGEQSDSSFGRDAIITREQRVEHVRAESWLTVVTRLREVIRAEQLRDVLVPYYRSPTHSAPNGFRLRETDGAFLRRDGGPPLAIHSHAWRQLIALLANGQHERGMAGVFAWLNPPNRSRAFAELVDRSTREEGAETPILLRSHLDPATGLVALRAVLSGIHSGTHLDDLAVLAAIEDKIRADAPTSISRGLTETHGWFGLEGGNDEARATVHLANSEVGACALKFWAGCHLRIVDSHVRLRNSTNELEVGIASASGTSSTRHTIGRKGLDELSRGLVAKFRIGRAFDRAASVSLELAEAWTKARLSFPAGWNGERGDMTAVQASAVILDLLEERAPARLRGNAGDRQTLGRVLANEDRLATLPFGSAAHIAAAFACCAREAATHEDRARLQELAGDWVTLRWEAVR